MKTLILNGSPNRESQTAALTAALRARLVGEVAEVDCCGADIAPCSDCGHCRRADGCAIGDGMQEVYRLIEESDAIVLASPVHFGSVSAPLFALFTRLQRYWSAQERGERALAGKRGCLLCSAGIKWTNMRHLVEGVTDIAFASMGVEDVVGSAFAYSTDKLPAAQNELALRQAARLGGLLAGEAEE